jgi:hypothetical protein
MPEAAVDKQRQPTAVEDDIRRAGEVTAVEPEAGAQFVKNATDGHFRRRVLLADAGHHGTSLGRDRKNSPTGIRLLAGAHRY